MKLTSTTTAFSLRLTGMSLRSSIHSHRLSSEPRSDCKAEQMARAATVGRLVVARAFYSTEADSVKEVTDIKDRDSVGVPSPYYSPHMLAA